MDLIEDTYLEDALEVTRTNAFKYYFPDESNPGRSIFIYLSLLRSLFPKMVFNIIDMFLDYYNIVCENFKMFKLVRKFIGLGVTFRQAFRYNQQNCLLCFSQGIYFVGIGLWMLFMSAQIALFPSMLAVTYTKSAV